MLGARRRDEDESGMEKLVGWRKVLEGLEILLARTRTQNAHCKSCLQY